MISDQAVEHARKQEEGEAVLSKRQRQRERQRQLKKTSPWPPDGLVGGKEQGEEGTERPGVGNKGAHRGTNSNKGAESGKGKGKHKGMQGKSDKGKGKGEVAELLADMSELPAEIAELLSDMSANPLFQKSDIATAVEVAKRHRGKDGMNQAVIRALVG